MAGVRSAITRWFPKRNGRTLVKILVLIALVLIGWNAIALRNFHVDKLSPDGTVKREGGAVAAGRKSLGVGHGRKINAVEKVYDLVKGLRDAHPQKEIMEILGQLNSSLRARDARIDEGMQSFFRWFDDRDEHHIYAHTPHHDFDDEDEDEEMEEEEGAKGADNAASNPGFTSSEIPEQPEPKRHRQNPFGQDPEERQREFQLGYRGGQDGERERMNPQRRQQQPGGGQQHGPDPRGQPRGQPDPGMNPQMRQGDPMMRQGDPMMRQGDPNMRQGVPMMRQGDPMKRQGDPMMRQGDPMMRQGDPMMRQGQPRNGPRPGAINPYGPRINGQPGPMIGQGGPRFQGQGGPRSSRGQGPMNPGQGGPKPDPVQEQKMLDKRFKDYEEMDGLIYLPEYLKAASLPTAVYNNNNNLSDLLPLNRPVADKRIPECTRIKYDADLPTVTFIIPFYNEAPSLILRTVHSIFLQTRYDLIDEVILVDDCSAYPDLKEPLERYLQEMEHSEKVSLLRNTEREGLIRTRQRGADVARGDVLIFMDAHTEVTEGYLEPILQEIVNDPKTLVQPMMIGIDSMKMNFAGPEKVTKAEKVRSTFSWGMGLTYLPPAKKEKGTPPADPFTVPTLVGCVMAVERDYFLNHLEGFDTDMDLWGAENMEVPFRYWMCGGRVITVPCSRVGHVFRKLPYIGENTDDQIGRNAMRVAEVWMGKFKYLFYQTRKPMTINDEDHASIQKRLDYKKRLQCKDFDWFLKNIMPDVPVPGPDEGYYGNVFVAGDEKRCLTLTANNTLIVGMECGKVRQYIPAYFNLKGGRFQHVTSKKCLFPDSNGIIKVGRCGSAGEWAFEARAARIGKLAYSPPQGGKYCLSYVRESVAFVNIEGEKRRGSPVKLSQCDYNDKGRSVQAWMFTFNFTTKKPENMQQRMRQMNDRKQRQ